MKLSIGGILVVAIMVLGVVFAYNRFSKDGVANLGRPTGGA